MRAAAPGLTPKTWYGMPAYAKDGKVVVFFKNAGKFKSRYSNLGFSDNANLDAGSMWPTEFALTKLPSRVALTAPSSPRRTTGDASNVSGGTAPSGWSDRIDNPQV